MPGLMTVGLKSCPSTDGRDQTMHVHSLAKVIPVYYTVPTGSEAGNIKPRSDCLWHRGFFPLMHIQNHVHVLFFFLAKKTS